MRRMAIYLMQFAMIVAALTVIPAAFSPSDTDTPYLSALSDLTLTSALAAPACNKKTCDFSNPDRARCVHNPGTKCASQGQRCVTNAC